MSKKLYEELSRTPRISPRAVQKLVDEGVSLQDIARRRARPQGTPAADPYLTPACEDYPAQLREISDPPLTLFYKGRQELIVGQVVAVVGSRKAAHYGLRSARYLGAALSRNGISVCSGLARGIDSAVHRGVLEEMARNSDAAPPVGVLGHGWGMVHPKENLDLFLAIEKQGLLFTEYPRRHPPYRWTFPARNRIIAGLSRHVVVVEAGEKSGSLHTARYALERQGSVWVVPGSPGKPNSTGGLRLIRDGANVIVNFDEFVRQVVESYREPGPKALPTLSEENRQLLLLLSEGDGDPDLACRRLDWGATELAFRLTELEMEGLVARNLEGNWDLLCWDLLPHLK